MGYNLPPDAYDVQSEAFMSANGSHEVREATTDPEPFSGITTSVGEICDDVAQAYALVNGYVIQSFWSAADNAFAVYDDNSQVVKWTGGPGGNLTVNGDQLGANYNDTITVDVNSAGQPLITLNGQTYSFWSGFYQLGSITINPGGGTNTVNVVNTAADVLLTINDTGNDTVTIGKEAPRASTAQSS